MSLGLKKVVEKNVNFTLEKSCVDQQHLNKSAAELSFFATLPTLVWCWGHGLVVISVERCRVKHTSITQGSKRKWILQTV